MADHARVGLSLEPQPMRQIRPHLHAARCMDSCTLHQRSNGCRVRFAGMVIRGNDRKTPAACPP
jgi:hypothetical protein